MNNNHVKTDEDYRKELSEKQYRVMRERQTEIPFSGKLIHPDKNGFYKCAACGHALFEDKSKFESGTGWPSFDKAIIGAVKLVDDTSLGMDRNEVVCSSCGSHLGHLFDDGPTETKKRYCVNSICFEDIVI